MTVITNLNHIQLHALNHIHIHKDNNKKNENQVARENNNWEINNCLRASLLC